MDNVPRIIVYIAICVIGATSWTSIAALEDNFEIRYRPDIPAVTAKHKAKKALALAIEKSRLETVSVHATQGVLDGLYSLNPYPENLWMKEPTPFFLLPQLYRHCLKNDACKINDEKRRLVGEILFLVGIYNEKFVERGFKNNSFEEKDQRFFKALRHLASHHILSILISAEPIKNRYPSDKFELLNSSFEKYLERNIDLQELESIIGGGFLDTISTCHWKAEGRPIPENVSFGPFLNPYFGDSGDAAKKLTAPRDELRRKRKSGLVGTERWLDKPVCSLADT